MAIGRRPVSEPSRVPDVPDHASLEALFVENLNVVDQLSASIAYRKGMRENEATEFVSWTREKFVEDRYSALAKYRGESSLKTYLAVVISGMCRDYRAHHWGRWRPSAQARRMGPLAMRLERLLYRDGVGMEQARAMLTSSERTALSTRQFTELLAALPPRTPLRPTEVDASNLGESEAASQADELVVSTEAHDDRRKAEGGLDVALAELPAEDSVMMRLLFWEQQTIADTARVLGVNQKSLYKRRDKVLAMLRLRLGALGVSIQTIRHFLDAGIVDQER